MSRVVAHATVTLLLSTSLLFLLLPGCGGDEARKDSVPTASGSSTSADQAAKTERRALAAVVDPAGAKGKTLSLSRVTVAPGDALDPHFHKGEQTSRIEEGTLTYTVLRGEVPVYRGSPEGGRELVREIRGGKTADIQPGEWVIEEESDIHAAKNKGDVRVKTTLTSLLTNGAPPATPANPEE